MPVNNRMAAEEYLRLCWTSLTRGVNGPMIQTMAVSRGLYDALMQELRDHDYRYNPDRVPRYYAFRGAQIVVGSPFREWAVTHVTWTNGIWQAIPPPQELEAPEAFDVIFD